MDNEKEQLSKVLRIKVNRRDYELFVPSHKTLLELLREDLGLTGTKHGCETGECGLCTVLIDDIPHLSCLTLALLCEGKEITTIEGLDGKEFELIQKAFIEEGAIQCGYCTPSMVILFKYLLSRGGTIDIHEELSGSFCRCTGYIKILKAYEKALELTRG